MYVLTRRSLFETVILVQGYEQDKVKCNCLFHTTLCSENF